MSLLGTLALLALFGGFQRLLEECSTTNDGCRIGLDPCSWLAAHEVQIRPCDDNLALGAYDAILADDELLGFATLVQNFTNVIDVVTSLDVLDIGTLESVEVGRGA